MVALKLLSIRGGTHVAAALLGGRDAHLPADPRLSEIVRLLAQVRAIDVAGPAGRLTIRLFARMVEVEDELLDLAGPVVAPIIDAMPDLATVLASTRSGTFATLTSGQAHAKAPGAATRAGTGEAARSIA